MPLALLHPLASACVGGGSGNSAAAVHGARSAMAALAGTGSGGDSGLGGASLWLLVMKLCLGRTLRLATRRPSSAERVAF
jgi:hypothetical protein